MKYESEVIIYVPLEKVIELFDSAENLGKWQEGLLSVDLLEGEAGQEGARSKLVFESRKGKLEMIETIRKRNFPGEYFSTCSSRGVFNKVFNFFSEEDPGTTRWRMVNIFRFRGMMALMAPFMRSAFQSNTLLNMERFKAYAENSK